MRSTLLILALLLMSLPYRADAEAPVDVFFGPKAASNPDSIFSNLEKFLSEAKDSIHGSIHEFDMIRFADSLVAAKKRGVEVHLVVENKWWRIPKNEAARDTLLNGGVQVTPDTRESGLNHNKFIIADGARVWTGSTNMTETCLFYNANASLIVSDKRVAGVFEAEFAEQAAGLFGNQKAKRAAEYPAVAEAGWSIQVLFSPRDDAIGATVREIREAKSRIDLICFVFSSPDITDALLDAQTRGVKVRVLLDDVFSSPGATRSWKVVPYNALSKAGVECKYDDDLAKLHHKTIIIDGTVVLTGSMNFSNNGAKTNDENTLLIHSPQVAEKFEQEFERLWQFYGGAPGQREDPDYGDAD